MNAVSKSAPLKRNLKAEVVLLYAAVALVILNLGISAFTSLMFGRTPAERTAFFLADVSNPRLWLLSPQVWLACITLLLAAVFRLRGDKQA